MPDIDIDPAALSRPSISLSTPTLSSKSITVSAPGSQKIIKTSQIIPPRIDLEPLYTALKAVIPADQWLVYKESTTQFLIGRLNQAEYSDRIGPILASPSGEKEHLHNQLIAAIYGNVTREMPDQGLAPWVSANDKPTTSAGTKQTTGDATERRLKGEVMQLPSRDRRRIKDLMNNEFDPYDHLAGAFSESSRRPFRVVDVAQSAAGINNMNFDLEIRKRFAVPLASESGEFPDVSVIEGRMLPFCYEAGLVSGHAQDAAQLMLVATEAYMKDILSTVFSRTRSNAPGASGGTGLNVGTSWIQTHAYKKQLAIEEAACRRGEITRDKGGLLPVEAKAASERGPLGLSDMQLAMELADIGTANFPVIATSITHGYREGELEHWDEYTWLPGEGAAEGPGTVPPRPAINGIQHVDLPNGHGEVMDIDDDDDMWWEGGDDRDSNQLNSVLDSCFNVG
ncbi:related to transcriptional coactivator HFI1 [Cephalotrichum gorgonifer]|uniref:Related to transcriptional coactivator HFI1 n=1 Tax=Cephalotrichum gorgonifer TaxID=2041049 RepID=A0AAE8SR32_9PEZI|nr:related to transcriptional coactivator HFI1 [Cephalotrichum gorgonifer]